MSVGKISFEFHTAAQSMGEKKKKMTPNLSFSRQRQQILGNVLTEHLNHFTHNLKWWHFQILLLSELLPSVGLMFLVGEYKYSNTETRPLGRALHKGCDPHQSPLTFQMGLLTLQSQRWPLQWRMHIFFFHVNMNFPSIWNQTAPLYMKYFCSAWRWGSNQQVWSLAPDHCLHSTEFFVAQHEKWCQCPWKWAPCLLAQQQQGFAFFASKTQLFIPGLILCGLR